MHQLQIEGMQDNYDCEQQNLMTIDIYANLFSILLSLVEKLLQVNGCSGYTNNKVKQYGPKRTGSI